MEHRNTVADERWTRANCMQGSNLLRCGICTECDSRAGGTVLAGLVKDCTTRRFCLMDHRRWSNRRSPASIARKGFQLVAALAGRMNARTADYAGAWLHETDRLEKPRHRGEAASDSLRNPDSRPYHQGRA